MHIGYFVYMLFAVLLLMNSSILFIVTLYRIFSSPTFTPCSSPFFMSLDMCTVDSASILAVSLTLSSCGSFFGSSFSLRVW